MNRERHAIILSIRPRFVREIVGGTKRVELRRRRIRVHVGQAVIIYSSAPVSAMVAMAYVRAVDVTSPSQLWKRVRADASLSKAEFDAYFAEASIATGVWLEQVEALDRSIALEELRRRFPWFTPPQSYRFVDVETSESGSRIRRLGPSGYLWP